MIGYHETSIIAVLRRDRVREEIACYTAEHRDQRAEHPIQDLMALADFRNVGTKFCEIVAKFCQLIVQPLVASRIASSSIRIADSLSLNPVRISCAKSVISFRLTAYAVIALLNASA